MGKPQPLATLVSRKLQQALKLTDARDAFAIQAALGIVNDVILGMARSQIAGDGDDAEKGRRSIIFLEINAGIEKCLDALRSKTESPPTNQPQVRLHLSHLD